MLVKRTGLCITFAMHVSHLCFAVFCRAKAAESSVTGALPAEKDIQLVALQDCNAQMLQVSLDKWTWLSQLNDVAQSIWLYSFCQCLVSVRFD